METFDIYSFPRLPPSFARVLCLFLLFHFLIIASSWQENRRESDSKVLCSADEFSTYPAQKNVRFSYTIAAPFSIATVEFVNTSPPRTSDSTFFRTTLNFVFSPAASKCNDNKLYRVRLSRLRLCRIFFSPPRSLCCKRAVMRLYENREIYSQQPTHSPSVAAQALTNALRSLSLQFPSRSFRFISPKKPKIAGYTIHHFHPLPSSSFVVISHFLSAASHRAMKPMPCQSSFVSSFNFHLFPSLFHCSSHPPTAAAAPALISMSHLVLLVSISRSFVRFFLMNANFLLSSVSRNPNGNIWCHFFFLLRPPMCVVLCCDFIFIPKWWSKCYQSKFFPSDCEVFMFFWCYLISTHAVTVSSRVTRKSKAMEFSRARVTLRQKNQLLLLEFLTHLLELL